MRTVGLLLGLAAAFALGCAIGLTITNLEIAPERFPWRGALYTGNQ